MNCDIDKSIIKDIDKKTIKIVNSGERKIQDMKDDNCIFCKLANGDIPTNSIYEDDDFNVILDASPATKGHALILPKQHFANIYEIEDDVLAKAAKLAKKIMSHEKNTLGCDGYNLVQNNGEAAGQTVFHFHMHLIPRYAGKEDILTWGHEDFSDEEVSKIKDMMRM